MVPALQSSSLVRGGESSRLVGYFIAEEEVEVLVEELHAEEAAHLDAVDYLVLA